MFRSKLEKFKRLKDLQNSTFPNLAHKYTEFFERFREKYGLDKNQKNRKYLINLFEKYNNLSRTKFWKKIKKVELGRYELAMLFLLPRGDKNSIEALLNNNGCSVDPSDMEDYIQFIKNATTKRCKKMLKTLKGMDSNKTNNFEISKC